MNDLTFFRAISAYATPAQATYVQQAQTAYVAAAPRLPTYDTYPPSQQTTAQQYALRTQVGYTLYRII
jgi:hypothetical protein